MKRLSVCMIVKDEEELLPRCLESLQGLADEIIVVDTGSNDSTKEIVLRYTDHLYDFPWSNDFAAARNESLRHATGTWILVIDADEYLSIEDHDKWREFLDLEKPIPHVAYTLPIINFTGDKEYDDEITTSPVTRLFPNFSEIYFERPIHEQLTRGLQGELLLKKLDLNIYHTGYQILRVTEKNKHERNMLILSQMKDNDEMSEYDWFTLGNQYRYAKEDEQALMCYEKALQGASPNVVWYSHCLLGLITLHYKQNHLNKSWALTEQKLSKYQGFSEYHAIKAIHFETLGFFEEAEASYLKAIEIAEQRAALNQDIWLIDPMYSFDMPVQQLIEIYFRMNNNQQAIYWISMVLNKNKRNPKLILKLLEWLKHNESVDAVIQFLNQNYDEKDEMDQQLLYRVALALGDSELINAYKTGSTFSHLSLSDSARLSIINQDKEAWKRLAYQSFLHKNDNEFYAWTQVIVGAFIWNDPSSLMEIRNHIIDESNSKLNGLLLDYFNSDKLLAQSLLEEFAEPLFNIAKQLFLLQKFELFDRFINDFQTPALINQLANYFYSINTMDLAMNYYSILLSNQQLNFASLENLAFYHYYHSFTEDALEFLKAAQLLQPKARHLYRYLIELSNTNERENYIERFKMEFPGFDSITFMNNFLLIQQKR